MSQKILFYCDESGAKGYADQEEAEPGEVGVFAGIMLAAENFELVSSRFDSIAAKYKPASGKLHIADLADPNKEALRLEIYQAIVELQLPCFWYAIHSAGLHAAHTANVEWHAAGRKAMSEARGGAPARIKGGSPRDEPLSMHVALFEGLYAHLIAFLMERDRSEVEIEVRTDRVDSPVMKKFVEVAEGLLDNAPDVSHSTGFDSVKKTVVRRTLSVEITYPPDSPDLPSVRRLSLGAVSSEDGLVLAADVLANSLNYHFKKRTVSELYMPLNRPEAVSSHPLAEQLDAFFDWGNGDLIGDVLYRHPKAMVKE